MKNIHVLPTDKPSRLHLWTDEKGTRPELCELEYSHTRNTQNIYITSNEEIKEGDWVLGDYPDNPICKVIAKYGQEFTAQSLNGDRYGLAEYDSKKIILTTDQDLIKDGVQEITDDFLEWFVKNPSCEEIKTLKTTRKRKNELMFYKIIIPKEELKQETLTYTEAVKKEERIFNSIMMKQETLEEVKPMRELVVFLDRIKKNLTNKNEVTTIQIIIDTIKNEFFEKVSKWQQEQDKNKYSEEEVEHLIHLAVFQSHCGVKDRVKIPNSNECAGFVNKWFEQHKKK
jgi:hypothetical protein